jgi:hypothetical protein
MTVGYVGKHKLRPEEQETILTQPGDNRKEWLVFSDDPIWINRLDKLVEQGHVPQSRIIGAGKEYILKAEQVFIGIEAEQPNAQLATFA